MFYAKETTPSEAQIRIRHNVDGVKLYNNSIHAGAVGVVITDGTPDNIDIRNNIFSNLSEYDIKNDGAAGAVTAATNLYDDSPSLKDVSDSNPIVGTLGFVDVDAADFRIAPGSDAIDNGVEIVEVDIDLEGVTRPQLLGYDLGAYEYTEGTGQSDNEEGDDSSSSSDGSGSGCFIKTSAGRK